MPIYTDVLSHPRIEFVRPIDRNELSRFLAYVCEKSQTEFEGTLTDKVKVITPEPGHSFEVSNQFDGIAGIITQISDAGRGVQNVYLKTSSHSQKNLVELAFQQPNRDEGYSERNVALRKTVLQAVNEYFETYSQ